MDISKVLNWRKINFDIHHDYLLSGLEWWQDGSLAETYRCLNCKIARPTPGEIIIPAYSSSTSYKAQMNSSVANNQGQENADGDYNISFDNDRTNGSDYGFKLILNIKHDSPISSMSDNFFIKAANDKIYQFNITGQRTGKSTVVFYTNLTGKGTNNSDQLTDTVSDNDKFRYTGASDNRNDYTPIGASFEADYCQFTKDCTYVFDIDYSITNSTQPFGTGNYGFLTVTVTHYPKVAGYEQYMGYTQIYTGIMRMDTSGWGGTQNVSYSNYSTFRIVRLKDDFGCTITAGDTPAAYTINKGTLKTQSGKINPYFTDTW